MRLIDADAFRMEDFRYCLDCDSIIQVLKYSPTIDAVPVVRCKDCKFWQSPGWDDVHYCIKLHGLRGTAAEEDFCSYGVRKDGDTNG